MNNFGLEVWAQPNATAGAQNHFVACNGNTPAKGWGIYQAGGGTHQASFGGVVGFGGRTAVAGTWTHLAVVRDKDTATLSFNRVASGNLMGAAHD